MAAMPLSGSITSPWPLSRKVWSLSQTSSRASRWRRNLSVRQSLASSTAARPRLPWYCSSFDSKRLNSENASAVDLFGRVLDDRVPERDLAVAGEHDLALAADR